MFHFTGDMYLNIFNSLNLNRVLDIKNILNFPPGCLKKPHCVPVLLSVKTNVKNIQVMLLALRKTYLFEKMKQFTKSQ